MSGKGSGDIKTSGRGDIARCAISAAEEVLELASHYPMSFADA